MRAFMLVKAPMFPKMPEDAPDPCRAFAPPCSGVDAQRDPLLYWPLTAHTTLPSRILARLENQRMFSLA